MVKCDHCDQPAKRRRLCWKHYELQSVNSKGPRQRCKFCRSIEYRRGLCNLHYKRLKHAKGATEHIIFEENI